MTEELSRRDRRYCTWLYHWNSLAMKALLPLESPPDQPKTPLTPRTSKKAFMETLLTPAYSTQEEIYDAEKAMELFIPLHTEIKITVRVLLTWSAHDLMWGSHDQHTISCGSHDHHMILYEGHMISVTCHVRVMWFHVRDSQVQQAPSWKQSYDYWVFLSCSCGECRRLLASHIQVRWDKEKKLGWPLFATCPTLLVHSVVAQRSAILWACSNQDNKLSMTKKTLSSRPTLFVSEKMGSEYTMWFIWSVRNIEWELCQSLMYYHQYCIFQVLMTSGCQARNCTV